MEFQKSVVFRYPNKFLLPQVQKEKAVVPPLADPEGEDAIPVFTWTKNFWLYPQ